MTKMISLEEARELVLSRVTPLEAETVDLLDAAGRVAAADLKSDIDVSPFAHAAMDGYAVRRCDLAGATAESPITLEVIDEVPAGGVFEGTPQAGQCVRIMTGAALPGCFDAVVKYEIVNMVEGDGKPGGRVAFSAQPKERDNVREAGEEARAGEIVVNKGEAITTAGVGFLAGCGVLRVPVYRKPRVAIIPIGSELVPPSENPGPGHIRNSNSYALAACAKAAGCEADMFDIVPDDEAALEVAVREAAATHDFVVTSGGASNGDFDFIKPVVERLGELMMTTVNMRPGKAQTFGVVKGTPVFGLPGNPAAAYCGFEMIIRPALRKMQGYTRFVRPTVMAKLAKDTKKNDTRRLFLRSTLRKDPEGGCIVEPAKNQSSGLFGVIQRSNCMAVLPEGQGGRSAGDLVECVLLDVAEETVI